MIASGPAYPDASTCAQALEVADRYGLRLSDAARGLLAQETPKELTNVTTFVTGSVRQLCRTAAATCRELGYEPVFSPRVSPARRARPAPSWRLSPATIRTRSARWPSSPEVKPWSI